MSIMDNYLKLMDSLKKKYITRKKHEGIATYPFYQFHYYEKVQYIVEKDICFNQNLLAVKLSKTTILFVDPDTGIKVYLSDEDIASMINIMPDNPLRNHIISGLQNIIDKNELPAVTFEIAGTPFNINGISFDPQFNNIICENPADISLNGNDFIALINLILEKEKTDRRTWKLRRTAELYLGKRDS